MQDKTKINLVYVASIGHSGSTLLECMLGAHSQIITCGEIHIWPHEIAQDGIKPCSCGESVSDCPFWRELKHRVNPLKQPKPRINFFREQHNAGHTLRLRRLRDFSNKGLTEKIYHQIKVYGENNYQVFEELLKLMRETIGVQPKWIVDASKDPYRLLWLVRSNLFNIKVLHVVKDPRAFAYSMIKKIPNNGMKSPRKRSYEATRQAIKWSIENQLVYQIYKNHLQTTDYLLVNYEHLAARPKESFKEVCKVLECNFEEEAVDNFRQGSIHTIAGNPMRYQTQGIFLDNKWVDSLPKSSRLLTEIATLANRSNFGY